MFLLTLLTYLCYSSEVLSLTLFSPCKGTDTACIEKSVNAAIPQLFNGIPELGIKTLDPLFIEKVVADLSVLKYNLTDSTFTGAKKSFISNLIVDEDLTRAKFDLTFPDPTLSGKYELSGKLFDFPVEGSGDYLLTAGKYVINVDSVLEKIKGKDGKTHVIISNIKIKCNAIGRVTFDFRNLFNGDKELAKVVHEFANENWRQVVELLQEPNWLVTVQTLIDNVNLYLEHIPLEQLQN